MVYQHACSYFQLCDHASVSSQLTVVFHDPPDFGNKEVQWDVGLPAAAEAAECYAKKRIEMHAHKWQNMVGSLSITGLPSNLKLAVAEGKAVANCIQVGCALDHAKDISGPASHVKGHLTA